MKKIISVLLSICLLIPCVSMMCVTSLAGGVELSSTGSQIPVVRISGDGEYIQDTNGNNVFRFKEITKIFSGGDSDSDVGGSAKNIISALVDGYKTGDYSNYYDVVYNEMSEMFEGIQLDKNGNVTNGTDIPQYQKDLVARNLTIDRKQTRGWYELDDYKFAYDWRLDPLEIADQFNDHIKKVKAITGAEKVSVVSRCIGTQVLLAYISKYGTDDLYGVAFDGGTVGGSEPMSEAICGKFTVDGKATLRLIEDLQYYGLFGDMDEFLEDTINMLVKCGVVDAAKDVIKETLYKEIAQGVVSAIARSTFYGCPCYWGCVTAEDYQDALNYVFGEEGSTLRTEYAGLIEKLDNYDAKVRQRIPDLLRQIKDSGCKVCVVAKYGVQMIPTCESMNLVGDQIASVNKASFGATTSTILDTLSDEYIQKQTEAGLDKYISPDKQIDASTCFWPDCTWFVKGATHSDWTDFECQVTYTVTTADRQLTIDDFDVGQYVLNIPTKDDNGNFIKNQWDGYYESTYTKMTEENCDVEVWKDDVAAEKNFFTKALSGLFAYSKWLPKFLQKAWDFIYLILQKVQEIVIFAQTGK